MLGLRRRSTLARLLPGAGVLLVLVLTRPARAGEACYLLMFASQRVPNEAAHAHTFATFVRASWPEDEPCPPSPFLETHTISWLPSSLVIRPRALRPEEGHNFDLDETLRIALDDGARVSLWDPYQIEPELYARARRQIELLKSGQVLFKSVDSGHRTDHASNCIHAVGSIAQGHRLRVASPGWGEPASYAVLSRLLPWVIDPGCVHAWVGSALGLDAYPIIYRDRSHPRSGAVLGPVYRLLGGERDLHATYGPPG
jgi:hypothetical protein